MRIVGFLVLLLVGMSFYSCTRSNDPEGALRSYINYRFQSGQAKSNILSRVTGDLKTELEAMTDDDFEKFANVEKFQKRKLKVLIKKCTEEQCYITYILGYDISSGGKKAFATEIKKIANVQRVDGAWKIADVTNVKTYFDSKEPLK